MPERVRSSEGLDRTERPSNDASIDTSRYGRCAKVHTGQIATDTRPVKKFVASGFTRRLFNFNCIDLTIRSNGNL